MPPTVVLYRAASVTLSILGGGVVSDECDSATAFRFCGGNGLADFSLGGHHHRPPLLAGSTASVRFLTARRGLSRVERASMNDSRALGRMRTERPMRTISISPEAMASSTVRRQVANARAASCRVSNDTEAVAELRCGLGGGVVLARIALLNLARNHGPSRQSLSEELPEVIRQILMVNNLRG